MSENAKTLTFVAVAAAAVILAVVTRPTLPVSSPTDVRNQPLYPDFTESLAVTSLEIDQFDEGRGELHPFRVAQVEVKGKNRWSIPSRDDYPADAKDQVATAAAGLIGLKILEKVSDDLGDQRQYGVVDPTTAKSGDTGVGIKVVMKNKDGKDLLALILGKEVSGHPELRYARKVDARKVAQAPIYIIEAKTDKLSTKFENWIERNLLQISTFDIKRLWVRDHSVDQLNGYVKQGGDTQIEFDDAADPKWKLVEDRKFVPDKTSSTGGRWTPVKPPADEELNINKLDDLKTALDDLKIVDVAHKPAGLSADLKAAADFAVKEDAVALLNEKGFFPARLEENGPLEFFSNEGEIRVVMRDGVEYVLRFGNIAGAGESKKDEKPEKGAKKDEEKKSGSNLNRYLFVMAEFNPKIVPKPELEPLPEVKKEDVKKEADKKPAEEKKPAEAKPDDKKPADKKADEKKTDEKKSDAEKTAAAERERIEKDNKRKQDEYDQKIADGKKRVAELNARFADWYYVIAEDVFRKIHLSHSEIFKKKEKEQAGEKQDEHAGHEHGAATPAEMLEQLKKAGPGGAK